MKFLVKLGIVFAVVVALFLVYSHFGVIYVIGGVISVAALVFSSVPKAENDRERKEPLFPSSHRGTDVSAAWLGAKMDEEEEMRGKAEKKPR